MSIRPLPQDVAAKIQSSIRITTLGGVVCELLKNSLDAGATKINISLDFAKANCEVDDDGPGIIPAEFRNDGGLGKLHHTSKLDISRSCHGYHGDFLASLGALSLLLITSHHESHHSHNSLMIHNSTVKYRRTPAPPEQRFLTFSHGTRVSVRDLFGSMPVRVKQRPTAANRGMLEREWSRLARDVVAIILAWPSSVSVSVRETASGHELRLRPDSEHGKLHAAASLTTKVSKTLMQARLADPVDQGSWETVSGSSGGLRVRGCISLNPTATRRSQFVCVGVQPVPNDGGGANEVYDEVNRVFTNSRFAVLDEEEADGGDETPSKGPGGLAAARARAARRVVDRWPMFCFQVDLAHDAKKRTKGVVDVDHLLDERYRLEPMVRLLKEICHAFLKRHHYQPRDLVTAKGARDMLSRGKGKALSTAIETGSRGTKKSPSGLGLAPFESWSRIKAGKIISPDEEVTKILHQGSSSRPSRLSKTDRGDSPERSLPTPLIDDTGRLLRAPFLDVPAVQPTTSKTEVARTQSRVDDASPSGISHLRSKTDRASPVSPLAGLKAAQATHTTTAPKVTSRDMLDIEEASSQVIHNTSSSSTATPRLALIPARPTQQSEWVTKLLQSWDNPAFQPVEPRGLRTVQQVFDDDAGPGSSRQHGSHAGRTIVPGDVSAPLAGRIHRDTLREAAVVGQLDRKFILVTLPTTPGAAASPPRDDSNHHHHHRDGDGSRGSLLTVIDQHAADERGRLEDLMASYFGPNGIAVTEPLQTPLRFEVSPREGALFHRFEAHFARWGIAYTIPVRGPSSGPGPTGSSSSNSSHASSLLLPHSRIQVSSLPPSILERCRQQPSLLINLLRDEVHRLEEGGPTSCPSDSSTASSSSSSSPHGWVAAFGAPSCPRGVLALLNSRACRSAVMFNDVLPPAESAGLVGRLAGCAFPFQCAHGRPSMVPLAEHARSWTGWDEERPGAGGVDGRGGAVAWKEWLLERRKGVAG